MNAVELKAKLTPPKGSGRLDGMSPELRRLEVLAAERDVARFLAGVHPPSEHAATKLGEIIARERLPFEEVGKAYFADPAGFELACRNPWQRLRYKAGRALGRTLDD